MNYDRLKSIYNKNANNILPIKTGMFLEIHENIWEWDTKRIWKFKCLVIKVKKPNHPDGTFTVRWEVARMTIEKIYPLSFPNFAKVLLMDDYKIRRSKLYYIRTKVGKDARFKSIIESAKRGTDLLDLIKTDNTVETKIEENVVEEKIEEIAEATVDENIKNDENTQEVVETNIESNDVVEEKIEEKPQSDESVETVETNKE